jgi:hypothetical protein
MLTGHSYRLITATLGIAEKDGKRRAVTIPSGAILKIVAGPTSKRDRMVDVLWKGNVYAMFLVDVRDRGEEIADASAST